MTELSATVNGAVGCVMVSAFSSQSHGPAWFVAIAAGGGCWRAKAPLAQASVSRRQKNRSCVARFTAESPRNIRVIL
jgi:hypothetical protein